MGRWAKKKCKKASSSYLSVEKSNTCKRECKEYKHDFEKQELKCLKPKGGTMGAKE